MSQSRQPAYRNALEISAERIAAMSESDLNVLMGRLLRAQAYKCGSPISELRVNAEEKAKDDGSDGWTGKPTSSDDWLGESNTCWQFKAGSAGEPAKLAGEVVKRIPAETLARGGRFVVVASGSRNGKKGERDRLDALVAEAREAGIPDGEIEVIGSERLASWCNQNPAVAAPFAGRPEGLWTLEDWSASEEHQVPWQATPQLQSELEAHRKDLDFDAGEIHHLHIHGHPGVGKTRLTLELCREAAWRSAVIYFRQAADHRLTELIDAAAAEAGVQLVVVADEVQPDQLRSLRDSIGRSGGRIRLITVGHTPSPDSRRIPALLVKQLDNLSMEKVVRGWYPSMPPEQVEFVVRFADGYVRLARLAADAVARHSTMDVRGLLGREDIRQFLDGMLGTDDRRTLHVVAVLTSVGWTEDKQVEGEVIARHFGLDWTTVQAAVEGFHRRFGIAPRGGRYRYISPTPLGIHLAVEAWTAYPGLMKSLPGVLPSDEAKDAYYERLKEIASNPHAREFAREELSFFFRLDDFLDVRAVRRWSALSSADPQAAAGSMAKALERSSVAERKRIEGDARREAVWTLVRLAWGSVSFRSSVKALALLAEAENESWGNNASAEFVARFQVFLGGSAVPYAQRMLVLDELLAVGRQSLSSLVIKALAKIGDRHAHRIGSDPASDELPESEWRPQTNKEHYECAEAALTRLRDIARTADRALQPDLLEAGHHLSTLLQESAVRRLVIGFFDAMREAYPEVRELLRREIAEVISRDKEHMKRLAAEDLGELEALHERFEDRSLEGRLRQHVGHSSMYREVPPDFGSLARELLSDPQALARHWSWLTSGEAADGWWLGKALAEADPKGHADPVLPLVPKSGPDHRLLCGYLDVRRQEMGDEWYDRWVAGQFERTPKPVELLFAIAWRCGTTPSIARMLATTLRTEEVSSQIVGQLLFGRWGEKLAVDELEPVLRAMIDAGHAETAIGILQLRLETFPAEVEGWKRLALELVANPSLIRSDRMANYHWKKIADAFVAEYPIEIAAAILREQASRDSDTWFAKHSEAAKVLHACVDVDPEGVWKEIQRHLLSSPDVHLFSIGFPRGILDRIPFELVEAWVAEQPEEHAAIVARLIGKSVATDETMASRLLGKYGDLDEVAAAFFSELVSGVWSGPASSHWDELAESLESVPTRTALPKLGAWAAKCAHSLRDMAERDRQREAERELRRR